LIEHPKHGWILYDTGYTQRFFEATKNYPHRIYARITQVAIDPKDEVHAQLQENGIQPSDIQHVIITHFHGDHVAGLLDFPNAIFYASRPALHQALSISSFFSFTKGILKALHPTDLKERTNIIEDIATIKKHPVLGTTYDLFHDDSIHLIPLPGHAAGQLGVLLETAKHQYLLAADSVWLKRSYEDMILPSSIVRIFFHSWSNFKASLKKLNEFHRSYPEVKIVPTHCAESTDPLVSREIKLNEL